MRIRNISANAHSEHVYDVPEHGFVAVDTAWRIVDDWKNEPHRGRGYLAREWLQGPDGTLVTALADEDGLTLSPWQPAMSNLYHLGSAPFDFERVDTDDAAQPGEDEAVTRVSDNLVRRATALGATSERARQRWAAVLDGRALSTTRV